LNSMIFIYFRCHNEKILIPKVVEEVSRMRLGLERAERILSLETALRNVEMKHTWSLNDANIGRYHS